jgi:parvulin-like peptidyl-prolyl isomerase
LAGKHRKEKIHRTPTKHQVSRWEREKRLSRIIGITTGVIIAAVLGIIGFWVYSEQVLPYQQTVIKVNDKSYNMDYFIKTLDFYTKGQTSDMTKMYTDVVAQAIPQSQAVIEGAQSANITVSDEELSKELELMKLPKDDVSTDMVKTRVIVRKYSEQQCLPNMPGPVEQAEAQAIFLETKSMADERRQKLLLGENFTNMAAMLSLDPVTQAKKGYLGWVPLGYEDMVLGTLKDSAIKNVLFKLDAKAISDPVYDANMEKPFGYWVLEVLEKDDTKGVHARGIFFSSKDDADSVRPRLVNGESWSDLAKQYSQHASKDQGGDLGWVVVGSDNSQLPRMLAAQEMNVISPVTRDDSIPTKGGYWLVQVLNRQTRPLDDSIKQSIGEACLTTWMQGLLKQAKVENLMDQKQKDFAANKVIKNRSQ